MRVLGRPYGPKPHNGILNRYEGTNITEENVVNHPRTQLIDALIESWQIHDLVISKWAQSRSRLGLAEG